MTTEATGSVRRFRPYPAYKDSGVDWIGEIPSAWDVRRLKFVAYIEAGQSPPGDAVIDGLDGLPFLQGNADFGQVHPLPRQSCDSASKRAMEGDLLLSVRAPVGALNVADQAYGIGRGLCAIRLGACLHRQFSYYLLTTVRDALHAVATGSTYDAVAADDVGGLPALVPPPMDEQRAIAAFLDRETAKIDALVAQKERLIALLQEQRTALITRAVTRGLDPNVPMKDSGIEWLGEIPAHWEVKRLKRMFDNLDHRRIPLSSEERGGMAKEYPYYGASGVIDHVEDYLFDEPLILVAEDGANLFSRSTPLAFIATGKYWVNNHAHILRPRDHMVSYWSHVLASIVYDPWITGSAQPKLTGENLRTIPLPVPPVEERNAILLAVEKGVGAIEVLMTMIRDAVDRLTELRTALISAAVTGKIDVREEVA